MLYNYLKLAFRNLLRYKLFSAINILGLSVSLASCLLLFLYAEKELSYDKSHGKDIYRLTSTVSQKDGEAMLIGSSSIPIAPRIAEDIPEIETAVRLTGATFFQAKDMIVFEENSYYIENGYVTDSTFFKLFKYPVIAGNTEKPLTHSNAVVLDKIWAEKLFGTAAEAIGNIVSISTILGPADYEVTAVIDNSQVLSHLTPSYLIPAHNAPWAQFFGRFTSQWVANNMVFTYLKLRPGSLPEEVNDKIHTIFLENGKADMEAMGLSKEMALQPVEDIHTSAGFMLDIPNKINLTFIKVLISIGVLILVLACVNYINLSTAQAGRRSLEVGIRKAMGVSGRQLRLQFLGESVFIVMISSLLSIVIAQLILPFYNQLMATPVSLGSENIINIALLSSVFLLVTALLAGAYPAIYLSSFKPVKVLKGKGSEGSSNSLRKVLVVLQFVISIVLISSIIIISEQVDYLKNKELGFNADSKLVIPMRTGEARQTYEVMRDKIKALAPVLDVSASSSVPGSLILNDLLLYTEGQTVDDAIHIYNNVVDLNYPQLLEIDLLAGNYFTNYNTDTTLTGIVLVNEESVKQWGLTPAEAVGKMLYFDFSGNQLSYKVIGVVANINQFSLHQAVEPLLFQLGDPNQYSNLIVSADLSNFQELTTGIERIWTEQISTTPFEYFTLDEHLNLQYQADFNTFNLIKAFALISLVISCLGLYALSMFVAERRFKEIGVRKALGASVIDVLVLVSKDLSFLIIIAFLISIPISYFGLEKWLETFAYRVSPNLVTYLIASTASLIIGWLTIGYQSYRAAKTNPVNVLRDE